MILVILEEILPLVVLYVPGLLPSTCILPSQSERIEQKAEMTRKAAIGQMKEWLRQHGAEKPLATPGDLTAIDASLLKPLCR